MKRVPPPREVIVLWISPSRWEHILSDWREATLCGERRDTGCGLNLGKRGVGHAVRSIGRQSYVSFT